MTGLGKGLAASLLAHGLIFAVVYAVPLDRQTRPDVISVDFTLVEQMDAKGKGSSAGTALIAAATPARRSVKTLPKAPYGDSVNPAEGRTPVQIDQDLPRTVSLTSTAGEGHPTSHDGAPVVGPALSESAGGPGGLGSGRQMFGSLDPGWAEASGRGSGDGGSPAALRRIRDEIMKNVTYPERARRMGWEGRVILSFMIYEDGSVHDTRVLQSSGVSMLDEAAKEALRKSALKAEVGKRVHVVLPIEYKLR